MAMGCAAEAPPVPTHRLIFDRPFLILLQRAEAKAPHFALWVGSGELLVRP